MADDDFGDFCAVPFGVDGEEAVHFAVEADAFDDFAAVGFERAAEVVEAHAAEPGDEFVGHDAGGIAFEGVVLPVFAPAADDVEAFVELGEEEGDVFGVVLEVAIHGDDDVAFCKIEPCHHGGGLAVVAAEVDDFHAVVFGGDFIEQLVGAIAGAVVHEDEFPRLRDFLHRAAHLGVKVGDVAGFVVDRDGDGKHCAQRREARHGEARRDAGGVVFWGRCGWKPRDVRGVAHAFRV